MIIGPTSHKSQVFGGLGLGRHKRTFFGIPSSHGVGISPQSSHEHSRCFGYGTKSADGVADLLEVLRHSPLEKLNFRGCAQIPSAAWQKLRGASWTNLREANFGSCLVLQTWLRCSASLLDAVFCFPMLRAIVAAVSLTTFGNIERTNMWNRQLQMVGPCGNRLTSFLSTPSPFEHSRCFDEDTKGADGAADLLEVLRNSPLEKLNFQHCSQIPSTAWQRVPSGAWPALRDAPGIPEDELSRIVSGGAADWSFWRGRLVFASDSGRTSEAWVEPWLF